MPTRNRSLFRNHVTGDDWEYGRKGRRTRPRANEEPRRDRGRPARIAFASAFTFSSPAGSFTAGAGDQLTKFVEDGVVLADEPTETPAAAEAPATETPAPVERGGSRCSGHGAGGCRGSSGNRDSRPGRGGGSRCSGHGAGGFPSAGDGRRTRGGGRAGRRPRSRGRSGAGPHARRPDCGVPRERNVHSCRDRQRARPGCRPGGEAGARDGGAPLRRIDSSLGRKRAAPAPAPAPEIEHDGGEPTIWLNRALPDPTPASARLKRGFARQLASTSARHGADRAAVLGVLRAQGERSPCPRPRRS